jgi:predicted amidohydrolase
LYQFAPRLRDPDANLRRIAEVVSDARADIVLTPELSVTGYALGDDAAHHAVRLEAGEPIPFVAAPDRLALRDSPCQTVLGLVEKGDGGAPFNAAAVCHHGAVRFRHRKLYLPTYGMFDEARFFGRGDAIRPYDAARGWRLGVLVCEDLWHPGVVYALAAAHIQALLVLAAAPGRGVWEGSESGGVFQSAAVWERIARVTAEQYGIYVALANRTGVEGAVTFAGGSLVVGPSGEVLARAGEQDETVLRVVLSPAEIERARRPWSHARDDDARLVVRELHRLVGA